MGKQLDASLKKEIRHHAAQYSKVQQGYLMTNTSVLQKYCTFFIPTVAMLFYGLEVSTYQCDSSKQKNTCSGSVSYASYTILYRPKQNNPSILYKS